MVRIRRFGVLKTATVAAVMYAVVVMVFVILFALLAIVFRGSAASVPAVPPFSGGTGFLAILIGGAFVAVLYAIVGFIFTAIACALYNVVAGYTGGIEVQLENVPPPPSASWAPATAASPPSSPATG